MGMFDVSDEDLRKWKQDLLVEAGNHITDEEVLIAAPFRRGGAAASMGVSNAGLGGIVYAGVALFNKKKAGGLPPRVMLVVTPTRLHAFKWKIKGRKYTLENEVAVWDRAAIQVSSARKTGMTVLTIESPAEGEKVSMVGAGVKDDPLSQEVISVLKGTAVPGTTQP